MYARVASFENMDPSLTDDLVGRIRERVPDLERELPGARGTLGLLDREARRSLGITFFDSAEAIEEAAPVFERMGEEIPEQMRGRRASVEVYEVILYEVSDEGAKAARVSTLEGAAERIDEAAYHGRESILPRAREMSGWKGAVSLADRKSGKIKLITLWESEDALRASEEQAERLRQESADSGGQRIAGVERYEVSFAARLAELRV
jgi:heme-degrading monooxygenase HmoA